MFILKLEKAIKVGNEEVMELSFDFDKLTGEDVIAAEKSAKTENPRIVVPELDYSFLTALAAKAAGVSELVIRDLPLKKFMKVKNAVTASFKESEGAEAAKES